MKTQVTDTASCPGQFAGSSGSVQAPDCPPAQRSSAGSRAAPGRGTVRSRKARKSSRVACGCYVRPGTRIIRCPDGRWRCAQCVIASLMAEPPKPGRGGRDDPDDMAAETAQTRTSAGRTHEAADLRRPVAASPVTA